MLVYTVTHMCICIVISELLVHLVCSHMLRRIRCVYIFECIHINFNFILYSPGISFLSYVASLSHPPLPSSLQPLPNSIRPVYSCTMGGTVICFTGFKDKEELVCVLYTHLFIMFYTIIPRYDMFHLISSYIHIHIYSIFAVVHFVGLMHCKYRHVHVRHNSACVHSSIQELMSAANVVHKLLTVVHVYIPTCVCSPCSMVCAPWPTWWGPAFARTSPAVSPTL